MSMNLVDICKLKYPGQVESFNIAFRQPEDTILFDWWKVPGIEQPLESELMAEAPRWQPIFELNSLKSAALTAIDSALISTAKERDYDSPLSCASYVSSNNSAWQADAVCFISWRDSMWEYAYGVLNSVEEGNPAPTIDEFIAGMPVISWP